MKLFQFWYEKFLMRFSFAFAFLAFLGVFVYAYITEITIKLPGETAPFSELLVEDNSNSLLPNQLDLPLEKAHRTDKELKNWLNAVVSEALTFDKLSFSTTSKEIRPYFTDAGLKQYGNYLRSSGLIQSIKNNDYRMGVFIDSPPLLIQNMPIQNVYRWKYQIPISMSLSPRRIAKAGADTLSRKLMITVQIRRLKQGDDEGAIAIESWEVKSRR